MGKDQIHIEILLDSLRNLEETVRNAPNNALDAARQVSAAANIPVGWLARIEMGFEVMGRDGEITPEEAMAVIDAASKDTFINHEGADPFFLDQTPFVQLMEMDAVLLANEKILMENERALAANEAILRSGLDKPFFEIKEISPLP